MFPFLCQALVGYERTKAIRDIGQAEEQRVAYCVDSSETAVVKFPRDAIHSVFSIVVIVGRRLLIVTSFWIAWFP